ncbi:hypothetical protein EDD21DRAFT_382242 [Dissophora ornata]|nr:hypothetical protein BGZ58_002705 [Dissophora ornata]KAI8598518.1 hypothetical protein EDD21DRAFT_382242 [Dissophora ornata]
MADNPTVSPLDSSQEHPEASSSHRANAHDPRNPGNPRISVSSSSAAFPHLLGGASSGFAFPSSKPFTNTLGPINPFTPSGSPSSTPEDTPLGTPTAELQKLNLGEERYARAIEDSGVTGSFLGTVPLPSLSQTQHLASKRRPSNGLMEPLTSSEAGAIGSGDHRNPHGTEVSENGITLASLRRVLTNNGGLREGVDDLESNIKHANEKGWPDQDISTMEGNEKGAHDTTEGVRRRKLKGGVLSHLLKLQRNEAAAAAVELTGSSSAVAQRVSALKHPVVTRTKKRFSYRSGSRNNSTASLKDTATAPPSATTTPRVSPRNSAIFVQDKKSKQDQQDNVTLKDDNRSIHRDIAEILTRQSFMIMMAKALILYGAPSHRIEETCALLARKMELDASFAFLPGLMTISFSDPETHTSDTRHLRCTQGMDMHKLAGVHRIALAVLRGESIERANQELEQLTLEPGIFPLWLTLLGWLGSSAFVTPLAFGGGWWDMLLAGFCGLLVGILGIVASKFPVYGNVFEITASILVGFIAKAFGDRVCFSAVALAGVVVLLPGLLLTQAIMELSSRNIVSGAVRMFYALMYAFFLGFGLTIGAELWDYISGDDATASASACQHPIDRWWYFLIYPAVSASINIVFNAHPRQWFGMTLVTAVGFVLTLFLKSGPQITAAIAAFAVGVTGQLYGRLTGQLSYVPLLSGVLLLVPGSVGVRGILAIIGSDPTQGFTFVLTMIYVAVAITLGVFCSALVWYPFWRRSTFMNF